MHILINGWFVDQLTSGSGQYIHHLLTHLSQQAQEVRFSVLIPVRRGAPEPTALRERVERALNDSRCTVDVIPWSLLPLPRTLAKVWWEQVCVPQAAVRRRADLVWIPYWAAPLWQPVPNVVTVHDIIPLLLPGYRGGFGPRLYTALVRHTAQRAAAIITVSHASARDIAQHLHVSPARVHVVHHGPNFDPSHPLTPDALDDVGAKYALPDRFFLYLGGFDRRKNVRTILRAYRRYLDRGGDPTIRLVIAGRLPQRNTDFTPHPQQIAAELNLTEQVRFCGWIDEADKAALYALSTAFVFPSTYEGFGMMVLEAMSAGAPVITSAE